MTDNKIEISVIIPVYNEDNIEKKIDPLLKINQEIVKEIIIVNSSEDQEGAITPVHNEYISIVKSPKGRAIQMNKGAEIARGKILLFLHIDTILPENAFTNIIETMKNSEVYAGAFDLDIDNRKFIYRAIAKIASLRSRITRIPFGDQTLFINKDFFMKLGMFKEMPLMEDVEFLKRIRKGKYKIEILNNKVITSARKWERDGVIKRTIQNWYIQFLYFLGMNPDKLARLYYGK